MPDALRHLLCSIVVGDRNESLLRCSRLEGSPEEIDWDAGSLGAWRKKLLASEAFMSLAYELAAGFVLMAAVPAKELHLRRVIKFSYTSYVHDPGRNPLQVWVKHMGRWALNRRRDAVDPIQWARSSSRQLIRSRPPDPKENGRLVLSTACEKAPDGLRPPAAAVAAALVKIKGPRRRISFVPPALPLSRRQTIRLRPTGATVIDGVPPGKYEVRVQGMSGFEARPQRSTFTIDAGSVTRLHLRTRRTKISRPAARAPMAIAARASIGKAILRGIGWRSKPLAIRVRSGEGGSYHCEFEAPPGLHVTRARLLSNLGGNTDGGIEDARAEGIDRPHDVDLVLQGTQRAHLYSKADANRPATGYAVVNLRPRIETIVRPAVITAMAVGAVIVFLAWWDPQNDSGGGNSEVRWALVALVLGGPGALAAYVSQSVTSRVSTSMLWGLRVLALVPTILSFAAAGVLALEHGQEHKLWFLAGATGFCLFLLLVTYGQVKHPRERSPNDGRQGRHFESHYSAEPFGPPAEDTHAVATTKPSYALPEDEDPAAAMRDRMLERIGGLTRSTRRAVLRERWFWLWEVEVPPALYFDSAESPAVFLRLPDDDLHELASRVRTLLDNHGPNGDETGSTGQLVESGLGGSLQAPNPVHPG